MYILKLKHFDKWLKKNDISDEILNKAVEEISAGLFEAYLGGFLYKKRIPLPGKGKRGSARTVLAYKKNTSIIFLFGFAKNQKDNITSKEQNALNALAELYLNFSDAELNKTIEIGELLEVEKNG